MTAWEIAAYVLALILVLVLCRIFIKPLKHIGLMTLSSCIGGAGLYLVNMVGALFQFSLGINVVTASVCGLLGVPGLIMLIALKIIYTM